MLIFALIAIVAVVIGFLAAVVVVSVFVLGFSISLGVSCARRLAVWVTKTRRLRKKKLRITSPNARGESVIR